MANTRITDLSVTATTVAGDDYLPIDGNANGTRKILASAFSGSGSGQTLNATVYNAEASAITKGQVVYAYAATGNKVSVKLAVNTSDATSAKTFGVVADASIAAGATGTVRCVGVLDGLDTSTYTEGATVYLSSTSGTFTETKPYAPNHLVYVGIIERTNAGDGQLYVKIQNGYELDEIHDVQITSAPAAGAVLIRDATNSLWKAATIAGTSGQVTVTNADASTTLSLPTAITNVNSLTATAATNLTLNGGSSGASIVAGQGANGGISLKPIGTGFVDIASQSGLGTDCTLKLTQSGSVIWYFKNTATTGTLAIGNGAGDYMSFLKTTGTATFSNLISTLSLAATTASTSTTTGALVVSGGVGINGSTYIGGNLSTLNGYITAIQSGTGTTAKSTLVLDNASYGASLSLQGSGFTNDSFYRTNRLALVGPFDINYASGQHKFWIGGGGAGDSTTGASVFFGIYGGNNTTFQLTPSARTSGANKVLQLSVPADTGITASTEEILVMFAGNSLTWADGTVATQRDYYFGANTYQKTTTSATFTDAATVYIASGPNAGTGVSITNSYGLWNGGKTRLDGTVLIGATTASTSTTTGALVVSGGVGVAGAGYFGGVLSAQAGKVLLTSANSANAGTVNLARSASSAMTQYLDGSGKVDANAITLWTSGGAHPTGYEANNGVWAWYIDYTTTPLKVAQISGTSLSDGALTVYGTTASTSTNTGALVVSGGAGFGGKISTVASATGAAGLNLPHGAAPTSPVNGDLWTTTGGLYAQINGSTVGPYGTGGSGGVGTVTSVSVVTNAGVSGSVATATSTPAITLTLGAITPSSVNSVVLSGTSTPTLAVTGTSTISGTHSGASSGTNTGDQTITLTGDVTGTGTGSFAATIGNTTVTNAKLANVATATIKGRTTAGTGSPEDLTGTQATALLDTFTSSLKGLAPASGGGTSNFLRADGSWAAPSGGSGTVTSSGTPTSGQFAKFTTATDITGVTATGTGNVVLATTPTITTPNLSGIVVSDGANVNTANAMGALAIDVTKGLNTKSISADSTFTFSATPATANTFFSVFVTNTDTASHTLTIPSSYSIAAAATITTCTIPASGKVHLTWRYDGTNYFVYGDPVASSGSGTVTSVSVVTANGVSGTVATSTTTPAITLSLGAITPTSVNGITFSGSSTPTLAITGTTSVSGANTGDQTITLTGDVTGSGTGSFATTIANSAVSNAKLVNSSVTIGSTSLSLGATATSFAGLSDLTFGTPAFSDTGLVIQGTESLNSFYQIELINSNAGTAASTDVTLHRDGSTASTKYIDLGINSSGFSGSGSLGRASAGYLYTQTDELVVGTVANQPFTVVTQGSDRITITGAGVTTLSGQTNVTNNTASTTTTNGALVVTGGVGVGGNVTAGGTVSGTNLGTTTAYRLVGRQIINQGTTTYTSSAGVTRILARMIAAGGGGGGVTGAASSVGAGGGGGGGSYAEKWFTVTPSTGYTCAVGAGGTAGVATGGTGGTGGNTTLTVGGTTVTCNGGTGGVNLNAGTAVGVADGGAGGAISTNGDVNIQGSAGGYAIRLSSTVGSSGAGGNGWNGHGGADCQTVAAAGLAGGLGAGGSGGISTANTNRAGGAGGNGLIVIEEYAL
jgi:hypothetical protein